MDPPSRAASAYECPALNGQHDAKRSWREKNARWLCAAIVLVLNLAFYAKAAPTLRLVELAVCREHYAQHDPSRIGPGGYVDESECKLDGIQSKVAWLFMADELLHFCCDFIAILPLGILANRIGPKPIMVVNFAGLILSWVWLFVVCAFYNTFSATWILLGSAFCLPGGATHFNTAIIYTEAAEHTTDWTTTFSLLEGLIQVSQLVGPIIGSSLLFLDIWLPYYVIIPIALLSIAFALALPPGKQKTGLISREQDVRGPSRNGGGGRERESLLHASTSDDGSDDDVDNRLLMTGDGAAAPQSVANLLKYATKHDFKQFWDLLAKYPIVRYAYAASFIMPLGKQALHILQQYVSKRFDLAIAKVGFLFSVKAVIVVVLYFLVLPTAQRMMSTSKPVTSVRLARVSIILLAVGTAVIGLAWDVVVLIFGLIIYAAGFGFPVLVRSLLSHFAASQSLPIPLLFSGVAITETAGSFMGAVGLTTAFTKTLGLRGWIQGLPFWICTAFYAGMAFPTFRLSLPGNDHV